MTDAEVIAAVHHHLVKEGIGNVQLARYHANAEVVRVGVVGSDRVTHYVQWDDNGRMKSVQWEGPAPEPEPLPNIYDDYDEQLDGPEQP